VDVARRHFLACAGLAQYQDVGVERGDLFDEPVHGTHRPGGATGAEAMRAGLGGMAVAHPLGLLQHRG
jgi:hypothetical protein